MFGLLLTLLILDGVFLGVIVLMQAGKGGGLAAMGGGAGTDAFMGGRQAATLLTKATWIGGGVFLGLALALSILSTRARTPESILQQEFRQQGAPAAQPVLPGVQPTEGASPLQAPTSDAGAPGSQQP